ncbi:hypothetical protein [Natranaerobius trueperi]|uniref:Uncharacterized protein n=1 Tax=Natranaerobius trueperi TaxID=759412 RepID=A0A226BUP2_9FIRM|nr:hypothetical protein [Natranaerobius trueperi]OWZ82716.1 hypothetical protein CDO51_12555 [Natranaerobius trueperi]
MYVLSGYYNIEKDEVHFTSLIRGEVGAATKPFWSPSSKYFAYIDAIGPGSPTNAIVIEGIDDEGFIIGDSTQKRLSEIDYKDLGDFNGINPFFRELEWSKNGEKLFFTKVPGPATPPEKRKELGEEGKRLYFDIYKKEIMEEAD